MKNTLRSKRIASVVAAALLLSVFNLFGLNTPTASANDFNAGSFSLAAGATAVKDVESPEIPGAVGLKATVKIHRNGSDNDFAKKKVVIKLFKPGNVSACETEPTGNVEIGQNQLTFVLDCGHAAACGKWKLSVRNADTGSAANASAQFSVVFSFNTSARNLDIEGGKINLDKGNSVRKSIRNIAGSGVVSILGRWNTDLLDILHIGNHKLAVRLLKNGQRVGGESGFAQNANSSPKVNFSFTITQASFHSSDQWEIEVENNSEAHLVDIDIFGTFTPGCF